MLRQLTILLLLASAQALANEDYRQQPCKTPQIAPSCIRIHGRLSAVEGTPSTRLWQTGTHHIYGIYSNRYGFAHEITTLDSEAPELHLTFPKNAPDEHFWTVYGEFEVCPLEPHIPGQMQAACIANATDIVVEK